MPTTLPAQILALESLARGLINLSNWLEAYLSSSAVFCVVHMVPWTYISNTCEESTTIVAKKCLEKAVSGEDSVWRKQSLFKPGLLGLMALHPSEGFLACTSVCFSTPCTHLFIWGKELRKVIGEIRHMAWCDLNILDVWHTDCTSVMNWFVSHRFYLLCGWVDCPPISVSDWNPICHYSVVLQECWKR